MPANRKQDVVAPATHPASDEFSDADLRGALAAIKHDFDPEAARKLIQYFHGRMRDRRPFNEKILQEYIEHAFQRIVRDGKSADIAFGLKRARGEFARPDTTIRDVQAAAYVVLLMRQGIKWLEAVGDAANSFFPDGKGDKAVQQAYADYKEVLGGVPDKFLKDLLPPDTPVISRNKTG